MFCRHCGAYVRCIDPPVIPLSKGLKELLALDLKPIVDEAIYRFGDKPHYPVPAIPVVVEYFRTYFNVVGVVMWAAPCRAVEVWVPVTHQPLRAGEISLWDAIERRGLR